MMTDSIADMLTRVRNAQAVGKETVTFPNSKIKRAILDVLKAEGFIEQYAVSEDGRTIEMGIRYYNNQPVIRSLKRVSLPSLRSYSSSKDIPRVMNGLGISVVSTSKGVMSDHQAREAGIGGEILCEVC